MDTVNGTDSGAASPLLMEIILVLCFPGCFKSFTDIVLAYGAETGINEIAALPSIIR